MGLFNLFSKNKESKTIEHNTSIENIEDLVIYLKGGDLYDKKVTKFLNKIVEDFIKYKNESFELLNSCDDIEIITLISTVYLSISFAIEHCYNNDIYLKASLEYENILFFNNINSLHDGSLDSISFIGSCKDFISTLEDRIYIIEDNKPEDIFEYNPFYDCVLFNITKTNEKLKYSKELNVF